MSVAILAWLVSRVDWQAVAQLKEIEPQSGAIALLLAGLAFPLQVFRWQMLLRAQGIHLPGRLAHAAFWVGHFYNSFLPGGIAGDVVRTGVVWRAAPDRKIAAVASGAADRLAGLIALLGLSIIALATRMQQSLDHPQMTNLFIACAAGLIAMTAAIAIAGSSLWVRAATRVLGFERAETLRSATTALQHQPLVLLASLALSIGVWLLDFIALGFLARAVGLDLPLGTTAVAGAMAYMAASLPISVGGHGVREGALVTTLAWLDIGNGVSPAVAVLAIAFWALNTFWSIAGAAGLFWLPAVAREMPSPAAQKSDSLEARQ